MAAVGRAHRRTETVAGRSKAVIAASGFAVLVLTLGMLQLSGQQLLLGLIPIDNDFVSRLLCLCPHRALAHRVSRV